MKAEPPGGPHGVSRVQSLAELLGGPVCSTWVLIHEFRVSGVCSGARWCLSPFGYNCQLQYPRRKASPASPWGNSHSCRGASQRGPKTVYPRPNPENRCQEYPPSRPPALPQSGQDRFGLGLRSPPTLKALGANQPGPSPRAAPGARGSPRL